MSAIGVADRSAAVAAMAVDWDMAEALLGGTRAMRNAGNKYLPRWPKEDPAAYAARLSVSVLFPAYKRTVQTLAAKPFSRPVTLSDDMSPTIAEWCVDIDQQGSTVHVFASEAMEVALGFGLGGILVDYPTRPADLPNTQAAERSVNLRPYWVLIRPQQILDRRFSQVSGAPRLEMLRLLETIEEPDGEGGTKEVQQVRVLRPGYVELYRQGEGNNGQWMLYDAQPTTLDYIPFVPIYGEKLGYMLARPPLLEVAHLNVAHWQSASDQQNILHVARVPILTVNGVDDPAWELVIGAAGAIKLPQVESKLQFVEHSGSAIGAGVKDLETLEERMRQAGAELLVLQPGRVTATQIAAENAMGMSVLQEINLGLQSAINEALRITADWAKDPAPGHVVIFNDFAAASLAEATAQIVLQANQAGKLSDETLFTEFQRRAIVNVDHTWADEQERIESQGVPTGGASSIATAPLSATAGNDSPEAYIAALTKAIADGFAGSASSQPAPVINIAPPAITVNVPEQPAANVTVEAPVVNVAPPAITVEAPVVNMSPPAITVEAPVVNISPPDVNVTPAPITVNSPPVNVVVERGTGKARLVEDDSGRLTGIELN